jgi:hypothetical protein
MGAWGYGILQNDDAQDGLVEVIHGVEDDISRVAHRRSDEAVAARVGGAVGLLLQLSAWFSLDPESEFFPTLRDTLEQQMTAFNALPRGASRLLTEVQKGKGIEMTNRPAKLNRQLQRTLFATPAEDFSTQRVFSKREPALFRHPEAARYLQGVADRCVERVNCDFADESIVGDLSRESAGMGAFATLLVLEPCQVDPKRFEIWRDQFHKATADLELGEEDFEQKYNECLELAFRVGIRKFSKQR